MNMNRWLADTLNAARKKPMPILSFPSVQLLGIGVNELISDSDRQARGMKAIADRVDTLASVSMMDLSVEAECFGSCVRFSDEEVPTVVGGIISTLSEADALKVPSVGDGRTGLYVEAAGKAASLITDRPVFGGLIGPFSLAGRLMDVTQAMYYCYDEPEMVHMLLDKITGFLLEYARAYKAAGSHGVVMAEPLAGLLSPTLAQEFSSQYVKKIVAAVKDENFAVIYHNCGGSTLQMTQSILGIGASAYHFGNAIDMAAMMEKMPAGTLAMGNLDPARQIRNGTPASVREGTLALLSACAGYSNFVPSTGCDIPPLSPWENIDAFLGAVRDFQAGSGQAPSPRKSA